MLFSCIVVLFLSVCPCLLVCIVLDLFLATCSRVDVELPEEPQYQYPEQPSSEQFEPIRTFLATLYPLNIPLGCILVSCAR